ncbi:hypothetical protein DSL72_007485 [Monilinia vaccinii-corymbosi]|uniref:tRNA(Phe) 7-[(3-amino-3-carboxypropyl)-4-demethylwyosine(37)-N(4)]-methyltransferase n=1 Tax=Monilinia vaccinii-corymbosi TaxID=61207 RepID=A0A8A3PI13_9HELO|nr:hypothetical protein DSL72_007485 [Monilinia vaccinii-corymbosi]
MTPLLLPLPQSFISKKKLILSKLAIPTDKYDDLSPKGSVDEGIRELIDEINSLRGCVTTSSCAGRVSVFLEGRRSFDGGEEEEEEEDGDGQVIAAARGAGTLGNEIPDVSLRGPAKTAGVGGKGGGGRWLFVSHEAIDGAVLGAREAGGTLCELLGMKGNAGAASTLVGSKKEKERDLRHIHFKFEPMILHVLTASLEVAQQVLSAALQAGFRESGALNLVSTTSETATPMVGIRCMGLTLESLVGVYHAVSGEGVCLVSEGQLGTLMRIANERFEENTRRIERFRGLLRAAMDPVERRRVGENGEDWEDAQARKERKRAEGLRRARELKEAKERPRCEHMYRADRGSEEEIPLDGAIADESEIKS